MAVKMKLKKGDKIIVIAGRDKGKRGEVIGVFPQENRALVKGVNMVKRHQKQSPQTTGGIISRESKIHISNLALIDPKNNKPTRIGYKIDDKGQKQRVAKASGEILNG